VRAAAAAGCRPQEPQAGVVLRLVSFAAPLRITLATKQTGRELLPAVAETGRRLEMPGRVTMRFTAAASTTRV